MSFFKKITVTALAVSALSACGGGSWSDEFFQADGSLKGVVCIDGLYALPKSAEAKEIVDRLFQYYGSEGNAATVTSARGYGANCQDYKLKAVAKVILTVDFYNTTIVPATKLTP